MGADLILQDITIRHKPTKVFWNKLEKALIKKVNAMTKDELAGWDDEITGNHDDTEELEDMRITAYGVIETAINDMRGSCRDMTWITLPIPCSIGTASSVDKQWTLQYTVYLAGGMSWGDSPGETYEDFYKFNMLFADYRYIDEVLEVKK